MLTPHVRLLLGAALLMVGAGCASVDFYSPKEVTCHKEDLNDTRMAQFVEPLVAGQPEGHSGFALQRDGVEALAARILLAKGAEHTIDTQYYLITNDRVGKVFIGTLLEAADRGVRVRLLLDDILAGGAYDDAVAALSSHPNFEVRIFNPFSSRGLRVQDGLLDFSRVNRRMHNKSFTVDNEITIIGGRNIADEYFGARSDRNFGDADLMCIGPVVDDVSHMFDDYWNSRWAAPVGAFGKPVDNPEKKLEELRKVLDANGAEIAQSIYGEAVKADIEMLVDEEDEGFYWAPYRLVYDPVSKIAGRGFKAGDGIAGQLHEEVQKATEEVLIVSPYFVPLKSGVEYLEELIGRGIRVRVVTNSLGANNHGIVHSGYMAYRKRMLQIGVELYEVKSHAHVVGVDRGWAGAALATLHTKAFLVDRDTLFLGSFNWDPRSVDLNTELGAVVYSEEMGHDVALVADDGIKKGTYRVKLGEKGGLEWWDESGLEPIVYTGEPDVGWWRKFTVNLGRMLPIRKQL